MTTGQAREWKSGSGEKPWLHAFKNWRKRSLEQQQQQQLGGNPQWMLKKVLMTFPRLSAAEDIIEVKPESDGRMESEDYEWNQKTKARRTSDLGGGHVMAERRRREKLNDRFVTLRTLVPFVTKVKLEIEDFLDVDNFDLLAKLLMSNILMLFSKSVMVEIPVTSMDVLKE